MGSGASSSSNDDAKPAPSSNEVDANDGVCAQYELVHVLFKYPSECLGRYIYRAHIVEGVCLIAAAAHSRWLILCIHFVPSSQRLLQPQLVVIQWLQSITRSHLPEPNLFVRRTN